MSNRGENASCEGHAVADHFVIRPVRVLLNAEPNLIQQVADLAGRWGCCSVSSGHGCILSHGGRRSQAHHVEIAGKSAVKVHQHIFRAVREHPHHEHGIRELFAVVSLYAENPLGSLGENATKFNNLVALLGLAGCPSPVHLRMTQPTGDPMHGLSDGTSHCPRPPRLPNSEGHPRRECHRLPATPHPDSWRSWHGLRPRRNLRPSVQPQRHRCR